MSAPAAPDTPVASRTVAGHPRGLFHLLLGGHSAIAGSWAGHGAVCIKYRQPQAA